MSAPLDPNDPNYKKKLDAAKNPHNHKPWLITPRRLCTPQMVKELKILINEVLDEREGKTGQSYFDRDAFKHRINEPEPEYKPWSHQSPYRLDELQE